MERDQVTRPGDAGRASAARARVAAGEADTIWRRAISRRAAGMARGYPNRRSEARSSAEPLEVGDRHHDDRPVVQLHRACLQLDARPGSGAGRPGRASGPPARTARRGGSGPSRRTRPAVPAAGRRRASAGRPRCRLHARPAARRGAAADRRSAAGMCHRGRARRTARSPAGWPAGVLRTRRGRAGPCRPGRARRCPGRPSPGPGRSSRNRAGRRRPGSSPARPTSSWPRRPASPGDQLQAAAGRTACRKRAGDAVAGQATGRCPARARPRGRSRPRATRAARCARRRPPASARLRPSSTSPGGVRGRRRRSIAPDSWPSPAHQSPGASPAGRVVRLGHRRRPDLDPRIAPPLGQAQAGGHRLAGADQDSVARTELEPGRRGAGRQGPAGDAPRPCSGRAQTSRPGQRAACQAPSRARRRSSRSGRRRGTSRRSTSRPPRPPPTSIRACRTRAAEIDLVPEAELGDPQLAGRAGRRAGGRRVPGRSRSTADSAWTIEAAGGLAGPQAGRRDDRPERHEEVLGQLGEERPALGRVVDHPDRPEQAGVVPGQLAGSRPPDQVGQGQGDGRSRSDRPAAPGDDDQVGCRQPADRRASPRPAVPGQPGRRHSGRRLQHRAPRPMASGAAPAAGRASDGDRAGSTTRRGRRRRARPRVRPGGTRAASADDGRRSLETVGTGQHAQSRR